MFCGRFGDLPLFLYGHRQAVPKGQNCRVELGRVVEFAIELEDRLGGRIRGTFLGDASAPQHIVGNEQSACAQAWRD